MKVAVVSDAMSDVFIFPIWHRYYGGLFGYNSLFVLTYEGYGAPFKNYELGGLIELPVGYEDTLRRKVISDFVASLLHCFDVVIRVDIDEFLVVDPRKAPSLATFLDGMEEPYLAARGFDVIQIAGEPPLPDPFSGPLLRNRSFAYPNSALNKTCIVKTPVTWSSGFHWSNLYPVFGSVFMLHMKRIDKNWQIMWLNNMLAGIRDNPSVSSDIKNYYTADEDKIIRYHADVSNRPHVSGIDSWYRNEQLSIYFEKLKFVEKERMYFGEYGHEHILCEIPSEWRGLF